MGGLESGIVEYANRFFSTWGLAHLRTAGSLEISFFDHSYLLHDLLRFNVLLGTGGDDLVQIQLSEGIFQAFFCTLGSITFSPCIFFKPPAYINCRSIRKVVLLVG